MIEHGFNKEARDDIEMAFMRILSTDGLILSGSISLEDRRERIRVTIMQRGIKDKPFDALLTYGQAFERCYQRGVELRRVQRPGPKTIAHQRASAGFIPGTYQGPEGPGDDDGDEENDEGLEAIEHGRVVGHAVAVPAVVPGPVGELVLPDRRKAF